MKKKLLLIVFMIFMLTGCSVDYQLTISKDGKVSEDARAMENSEFFKEYEKSSIGRVVGFLIEPYSDTLNENNYNTTAIVNTSDGGVRLNKEYNSVEEYAKNTLLTKQFSDKINYSEDGNNVSMSIKGMISKKEQNQDSFSIDKATIIIELPFEVSDHNADKVSGHKYIWYLKSNEEKEIKIKYNKAKIAKETNIVLYIFFGILGVVILVGGFIIYSAKQKRAEVNKI